MRRGRFSFCYNPVFVCSIPLTLYFVYIAYIAYVAYVAHTAYIAHVAYVAYAAPPLPLWEELPCRKK